MPVSPAFHKEYYEVNEYSIKVGYNLPVEETLSIFLGASQEAKIKAIDLYNLRYAKYADNI